MAYRFANVRVPNYDAQPGLIQGFTRNVTASWRQCGEGMTNGDFFDLPNTEVDCKVSSSSTTANQTVLIIGFNEAGDQQTEIVVLQGQTSVTLTKKWFRIKLLTLLASTQTTEPFMDENEEFVYLYETNATVTNGIPDTFFGIMDLGKGISKAGYWYLPANKYLAFVSGIINMDTSGGVREIRMLVQYRSTGNKVWKTIVETVFANGISNFPLDCTPTLFDPNNGTDIRVSVQLQSGSTTNGAFVALHLLEEFPP